MNKAIYLLFLYISSSLAATTSYVSNNSFTTIPMLTKEFSMSTTSTKKITTNTTTSTKKLTTNTTTTTAPPTNTTTTAPPKKTIITTIRGLTSTATMMETSEESPIPLPKSLSEKIDYQINQTRLLTGIAEDNRAALKRLTSMISHLLDNDANMIKNDNNNDGKQHIQNMQHTNSGIHPENDTLHVSFGTAADPNRYPWVVAIRGNDRNRCGGTLIDDQHVLTAAHCIGRRTTTVLLGSHLYDGGEEVKTSFDCVHSAYSSSGSYRNDIAIIRLAKPATVRLPKRISTINLCNPNHSVNTTVSSNTTNLWMVGWGLKNNNILPNELQEAQVTLADRTMCQGSSRYTDICVQSRSNTSPMGACAGDSGSGLFQQTILTNQWCILAIASTGYTNACEQEQFTRYIEVASQHYVEWFKDVLDRRNLFDDLQKLERCKPRTWEQELCRWSGC